MPYLTHEEYSEFGFGEIDKVEFDQILPRASDEIDNITRSFYQFNDIDDDVEFRRTRFKKAIASQVQYFYDMGATTSHELNNPLSVQIGRTQVSSGERSQQNLNTIVSKDALMYLRGTGLLYRGLGVRS